MAGKGLPHVAELVRGLDDHPHTCARHAVEHVGDGPDPVLGVEHLRLERLPPREGQELTGELGGAVNRVRDGVEVTSPAVLGEVRASQKVDGRPEHGE